MAGVYVHIPFCASRCSYCDFFSTLCLADAGRPYVDAVIAEAGMRRRELRGEPILTLYLGGGTPSQLPLPLLSRLVAGLRAALDLDGVVEFTVEANPDDVVPEWCAAVNSLGVNRVSMGVQSFENSILRAIGRRHNAAQVNEAVAHLRQAGISNISIDLMYGFPGETLEDWQRDIDAALALGVEHLSAYCLMVEEGTALYEQMRAHPRPLPKGGEEEREEEMERAMYELLIDRLTAAGYEHYEISNFALRPAGVPADQPSPYRSRHNSNYWNDTPYIGLGAAAHSYTPAAATTLSGSPAESVAATVAIRSWNVSDLRQYIEAIEHGERPCEEEVLDKDTRYNDRITVALRTSDGLDLTTLSERHRRYCMKEAHRFLSDGLLTLRGQHLVLTRRGLFVSDMVMSALMMV